MQRKILKCISILILIVFTSCSLFQPGNSYAASNAGTLKIFSEVKDIELFIDEQPQGKDKAEINNVQVGSHYVKAVKDGTTVFSELITVSAGATTTILIKDTGQVKAKILGSKYKEQQEYKSKKLDILLSKSVQTVGSSYTTSDYFPGYYSIFGSEWTNSKSTAYETTDWKIIQGGVQQISDVDFAALVNDKEALKKSQEAWDTYNNNVLIFGIIGIVGLIITAIGISAMNSASETGLPAAESGSDSGAATAAVGIVAAVIGCGVCLSVKEPSGHLTSPGDAAKKASQYNQKIKADLGLPENYEPQ
ncbi:MAG: hypothetical protein ABH860_01580 [bacterium]